MDCDKDCLLRGFIEIVRNENAGRDEWTVPKNLAQLIVSELDITPEEIAEAEASADETNRRAVHRLLDLTDK